MASKSASGQRSFVVAEERGLVSVVVSSSILSGKLPTKGCRLRLSPPKSALREDGHVFDREAALDAVAKSVIATIAKAEPSASWTDTTIGHGRVTVSFAVPNAAAMKSVLAAANDVAPKGWKLEEALPDDGPAKRLHRLRADAELVPTPSAKDKANAALLETALAKAKSPGSFREQAGLDGRSLDAKKIAKALSWLSSTLPAADDALRKVLGPAARDAQLNVYVNAHPQMRQFSFELVADEDHVALPRALSDVLGRFFDAPEDDARRICGPLWERDELTLRRAPRITLDASS